MTMQKHYLATLSLLATCMLSTPSFASVEDPINEECPDNNVSCSDRHSAEPETAGLYDPLKFSKLRVKLGVQDTLSYNDNIFRSSNNEESDFINRLIPQIRLKSNFTEHSIDARVRVEQGNYFSNTRANYTDASVRLGGRYDIVEDTALHGGVEYRYDHIDIGSFTDSPDSELSEPTIYEQFKAFTYLDSTYRRVHVIGGFEFNEFDFDNTSRRNGTINIQDDRDVSVYKTHGQIGYPVLADGTELYVGGVLANYDHDTSVDSSALFSRDSDEQRIRVGLQRDDRERNIRYNVAIGYLEQDYDSDQQEDIEAVDLLADATWDMTESDSLRVRLNRDTRNSYSTGVSGYLQTRVRVAYEHQYDEAVSLGTSFDYAHNAFATNESLRALDREDKVARVRLWGEYEIIDDLNLGAYYLFSDRNSNESSAEFTSNTIGTSLSYKF